MAPRRVAKPHLAQSHSRSPKARSTSFGDTEGEFEQEKGGPARTLESQGPDRGWGLQVEVVAEGN